LSRQAILLIVSLSFLAYANTLFNDFTGDAYGLFVENHFYENAGNVVKVFTDQLVMAPADLTSGFVSQPADYSGLVSYRPVTALSFFFDCWLWKNNPFGYHLTNLILHIVTAILVYALTLTLNKTTNIALLAGILFGIHPIQAEVVNHVGYRSDNLAVLFYLLTILAYRQFRLCRNHTPRKTVWLLASILFFFLALFSKESALTLPLMLILYDYWFVARSSLRNFFIQRGKIYLSYAVIFVSYIFIYFQVMSNVFYSQYRPLTSDGASPGAIMTEIFFNYLVVLILPWQTTVLPPLYAPDATAIPFWHIALVGGFIVAALIWGGSQLKKNRANAFAVIWFFLTYVPTANLLTLLNPFAFRFMYLPSIGFFIVAAWAIDSFVNFMKYRISYFGLQVFRVMPVALLLVITIPLNPFFKNNIIACQEMVRVYPNSSRPYWLLGLMYFRVGNYEEALKYLEQYLNRPPNLPFVPDPRRDYAVYHLMGRCYVDDPNRAIAMFHKAVALNPDLTLAYVDLAKAHILNNDFEKALAAGRRAILLEENLVIAYVYAIHSHLALGDLDAAKNLLAKALTLSSEDSNLLYLKRIIEQNDLTARPVP